MKNEHWATVRPILTLMESVASDEPTVGGAAPVDEFSASDGPESGPSTSPALSRLRRTIHDELVSLQPRLTEIFSEREAYQVLFPIVLTFDELVRTRNVSLSQFDWPPLQKELYQTDEGGDLFFESLEELLEAKEPPLFALQIYLYCLRLGFMGRYGTNAKKLAQYKNRIRQALPLDDIVTPLGPPDGDEPITEYVSARWYYLGAAVILVLLYLLLTALAPNPDGPI